MLYDVAIIGIGVAGACAAIELSRAGVSVLLLEKERELHHKVCGEFISGECLPALAKLGVDFEARGASHIHQVLLQAGRASLPAALPFGARGLSRLALDGQFVNCAEDTGAHQMPSPAAPPAVVLHAATGGRSRQLPEGYYRKWRAKIAFGMPLRREVCNERISPSKIVECGCRVRVVVC